MNYFRQNSAAAAAESSFSEIINEFEESVSDETLNNSVVSLVRQQNNSEWMELHRNVFAHSHLIEKTRVERWKCFVLAVNPTPTKRYRVGIVDFHNQQTKTSISRHLGVYSTSAIDFQQLQPGVFDMLFNAVYSTRALVEARTRQEKQYGFVGGGQKRIWGAKPAEINEDGSQQKSLEDFSGQRLDLTNLKEYYEIRNGLNSGLLKEHELPTDTLVRFILIDFLLSGASDMQIHCGPEYARIRYRFQGDYEVKWDLIPLDQGGQLCNSICILSGKDPAKMLRVSVESVIKLKVNLDEEIKNVEARFESMPTSPKPSINLRIQAKPIVDIRKIGYYPDQLELIEIGYSRRNGVNIWTGETGSGKSNSLNAVGLILEEDDKKNIVEFGSPVEFESSRRVQVNIRETALEKETDKIYAEAFKASLRFDPDILFFTEIRNTSEAKTALRAANTGHLVFTTMHAADVEEAFARLFDMGLSRDMIAKGIVLICAQTLIKKLCKFCKIKDDVASVKAACPIYVENKNGCEFCKEGYSGRTVVAEVLLMTDDVREWIRLGYSPGDIRKRCVLGNLMVPLNEIALRKVRDGITTESQVHELTADAPDYRNHSTLTNEEIRNNPPPLVTPPSNNMIAMRPPIYSGYDDTAFNGRPFIDVDEEDDDNTITVFAEEESEREE